MTLRLYYTDSESGTFEGRVRSCKLVDGRHQVILDRTAFYPTSGGQPFDTGQLNGVAVVDVFDTDEDDVVHVVGAPLEPGTVVRGEIDRPRRLDHMQQHTGQHILSAAFDHVFRVRTMSFHMGAEVSTIDLAREVAAREIDAVEAEANRVVWENRPVRVRFASDEEAARLPLRKESVRTGTLRLVDVEGFDLSACGGTHVASTAVIGVIAVTAVERVKAASRVSFVCGGRALRSHATLRDVVLGATRSLSVTPAELKGAIDRTLADAKDASRRVRGLQDELAIYRAAELRASAETIGPHQCVLRPEPELDSAGLKSLAAAVVSGSGLVTVLVGRGTPAPVVVARSADVALDASALMRETVAALGGRGGGTATLAQGGVSAAPDQVIAFVEQKLSAAM